MEQPIDLTLRDYFAAQVAPSIVTQIMKEIPGEIASGRNPAKAAEEYCDYLGKISYAFADAMLAERAKKKEGE